MDAERGTLWERMTWEEIGERIAAGMEAVLFPIGATEQHGPHLATGMDSCLAQRHCQAVSRETGVPSLPLLPYGCSLGHSHRWPGTLSLSPATLASVVSEIGE